MEYIPTLHLIAIALSVCALQYRKAQRFDGMKRKLSLGVSLSNAVTALALALVLVVAFQGGNWPGFGLVIIASILLSVALWTGALIWTGPAEPEDRRVFQVTFGLMGLLVLTTILSELL